ncbi:chromosomal replication initiator, DnaA [Frigidibacter mobilis]|uniref:Chromosomal replication initiator, DnaA n=1 Tax=Frigidibacter mobilis TaxID=1335048 RepID=A0A159Z3B1_9RHOB|nr:chromosomal replication initiator, DnaA [Frigidibacter mobilis]
MAQQLAFDLPPRRSLGRGDFFVAPSNALALAQIDGWRDWPQRKLVLVGPEGSGKTHLAHVWATETGAELVPAAELPLADVPALAATGAVAVENADRIAGYDAAEAALFHLHNLVLAEGGRLLVTARSAPHAGRCACPILPAGCRAPRRPRSIRPGMTCWRRFWSSSSPTGRSRCPPR